jgi:hypothetical protein
MEDTARTPLVLATADVERRVTPPHGSAGSSLTDLEDLLVLTTDAVN